MTQEQRRRSGGELFIVDNSDSEWKVQRYLRDWCDLARAIDIATGYFEIGSLLSLDGEWQKLDHIRILMGDEVSKRTKRAFEHGLDQITGRLDGSIEAAKNENDFLEGVPAIVQAIHSGKIQARVYRQDKFHAKAYITHHKKAVAGAAALVGSSNFTYPGLHQNVELNVHIRHNLDELQEWFERYWDEAEDVTPEILRVIERHTREYSPFEIWLKSLDEFFRSRELEPDVWDQERSLVFPVLDRYQQDAYRNLLQIADRYGGAFLCDGVGLGKTYVGLMLIERLVFKEGKQVVLFAPKAAREDVWVPALREYLPQVFSGFVNLKIYNHTDLQRKGDWPEEIQLTIQDADVILIDEAHHFRNPGIKGEGVKAPSRYRQLQGYIQDSDRPKQVFYLTATPINNSIHDFRHIIELYTGANERYFAPTLGIHSLRRHFIDLEKAILEHLDGGSDRLALFLDKEMRLAEQLLRNDTIFQALVVQRSRSYVKRSQQQSKGSGAIFPERGVPQVVPYSIKSTYGALLASVRTAFQKDNPLFVLGIYYPLAYWKGDRESFTFRSFDEGRQKQVVMLIRTLFLKRFESSARAFEGSCWRLLRKLFAWVTVHAITDHDQRRLERWKIKNATLINYVQAHQLELWPNDADEDEVEEFLDEDVLGAIEQLDPEQFDVDAIMDDTFDDLDQLADFLREVGRVKPERDDKLKALIKLLKSDPVLKREKLIVFTEYADTARYLEVELTRAGITGLHRIDGSSDQKHRSSVIRRFSPYYNGLSTAELEQQGKSEIRVLVSTDVLSEGLNLQDATRLINYDLHWNPVRLMQRVGRVDRRMNPAVEQHILHDHPEMADLRGKVAFWNFLPPDELDELLSLFKRVTNKVLVISRTLGIEGRQLLTPDDTFDPIRELNEQCDGELTEAEELRLEYLHLLEAHPELAAQLANLPLRVFSGREAVHPEARGVFFCYRIPRPDPELPELETGGPAWSDPAGFTVWLYYDLEGNRVLSEPAAIAKLIRSEPATSRICAVSRALLSEMRKQVEKELVKEYLRPLQAPPGVNPILKCWMELN